MFITHQIIMCTKYGISKYAAQDDAWANADWQNQEFQTINLQQNQGGFANQLIELVRQQNVKIKDTALTWLLNQGIQNLEKYIIQPSPQGAGELARSAILSAIEIVASNTGGFFAKIAAGAVAKLALQVPVVAQLTDQMANEIAQNFQLGQIDDALSQGNPVLEKLDLADVIEKDFIPVLERLQQVDPSGAKKRAFVMILINIKHDQRMLQVQKDAIQLV